MVNIGGRRAAVDADAAISREHNLAGCSPASASRAAKRITPHECRHTYASLSIAAGVNAKALSTYMGHANIKITLDLYGHLFPGNEGEAAALLDTYLDAQLSRAADAARSAGAELTGAHTGAQVARSPDKAHEEAV